MLANSTNFLKKYDFGAVQRSALCRSRRELSNAYLLAKFGFDTAENGPSKVCPIEQTERDPQLAPAAPTSARWLLPAGRVLLGKPKLGAG